MFTERAPSMPGRAAEDELGGAAADVGDQVRRRALASAASARAGQFPGRAGEGELCLLVARDDLRRDAEHVSHPFGELRGVGRVPGRAGRHHPDGFRLGLGDQVRVLAQRGHGPVEGRRRQPPGAVDALAQPDDPHLPGQVGQRRRERADVGDEQPDGIGAAVDRGHALGHSVSSGR